MSMSMAVKMAFVEYVNYSTLLDFLVYQENIKYIILIYDSAFCL